jgi:hypothetical protein
MLPHKNISKNDGFVEFSTLIGRDDQNWGPFDQLSLQDVFDGDNPASAAGKVISAPITTAPITLPTTTTSSWPIDAALVETL